MRTMRRMRSFPTRSHVTFRCARLTGVSIATSCERRSTRRRKRSSFAIRIIRPEKFSRAMRWNSSPASARSSTRSASRMRSTSTFFTLARVKNVLVDLIREAERVELLAEAGYEFHLIARENFSGRIIRIANDDRFRLLVERRSQLVAIETPVRRAQRNVTWLRVGKDRTRRIFFNKRPHKKTFFARIDCRHHRRDHAFG